MFKLFSVNEYRSLGSSLEASVHGEEYEEALMEHYCEEQSFTAQYEEDKGKVFKSTPFGHSDMLAEECMKMKRHIYRTYRGKNPATKEDWTAKDGMIDMLASRNAAVKEFLGETGVLRKVVKAMLVNVTTSSDIERVFSSYTLFDNKLNQAASPKLVEEIIVIMKESPAWPKFDSDRTVLMWRKVTEGTRKLLSLPPIFAPEKKMKPASGKCWVKSAKDIKATHLKRKVKFERAVARAAAGVTEDEDNDVDTVDTDDGMVEELDVEISIFPINKCMFS